MNTIESLKSLARSVSLKHFDSLDEAAKEASEILKEIDEFEGRSDGVKIKELAEEYDVSFYNDYSGRAMYGRKCVGIVCCHSLIDEIVCDAALMGVKGHRTDGMGLNFIVYWPDVEPVEGYEAGDEDEE